jgi:hypothetical protein
MKPRWLPKNACEEAVQWVGSRTEVHAWAECERPEWMLWLAARKSWCKHVDLVRAACSCARTALRYVPNGETHPRKAIEAADTITYNTSMELRGGWHRNKLSRGVR